MYLSEIHQDIRQSAAEFAEKEVQPLVEELDKNASFPNDIYLKMGEMGLFGVTVPEELGGLGMDHLSYSLIMEELAAGYASVADQCGLVELLTSLLCNFGTSAQQEQYLKKLISSEIKGSYCITEAEAGSDVSGIKTLAIKDNKGWVLSGEKMWIHNAPICDLAFVLALTNPEAGNKGMSIFIVDANAEGVTKGTKEDKMGQRASQVGSLHFDSVRLPPDAMLGEENKGFQIMMSTLDKGRVGIGSLALGISSAALKSAVEYTKTRKQFGKSISSFQGIQWILADMKIAVEASRLLCHQAAVKMDKGERATSEASCAKCFAGDTAVKVTADAVQLFGGSGYIRGFEVERLYRDAKITQIYEGTNQVQRIIIARNLLKE